MNPAEAIEAAELAERETAYRNQLARQMYEAGRRDAEADMARHWAQAARPAARGGVSYAELEDRRWGPGGRAQFAAPRPGDFPGQANQTETQGAKRMTPLPFEIPDPAQAADVAAEFDPRCLENEEAHWQQWQAESDAEAWGGREPSASYAEWVAEGREPEAGS